jgi:hypothetical protein
VSRYESRQELANKADYEGGILDMLFGYGLSVGDVPEGDLELREAIAECLKARPAVERLEALLPVQIELAASVCQSFALDNGAFSMWRAGKPTDWPAYYEWAGRWLQHPACDFAVIPDVIGGTEDENDALIDLWPHGDRGMPVWHLNESIARLARLVNDWPRVALGSAAEWDVRRPKKCLERIGQVFPHIVGHAGYPLAKLHGLRMLNPAITSKVPLASADSTNVARNIGIDSAWTGSYAPATKEARADVLVQRIESTPTPAHFCADVQAALFNVDSEVA